ncbi:MAG: hypothetical protein R3A80_00215 [Bdellovibrionota bacterium]
MSKFDFLALLIGFGTGLFLIFGGAYVLKRTFRLMDAPEQAKEGSKSLNWSFSQAIGLASLWTSKIIIACAILYFSQKEGFSTQWLGLGVPLGILIGALTLRKKVDTN